MGMPGWCKNTVMKTIDIPFTATRSIELGFHSTPFFDRVLVAHMLSSPVLMSVYVTVSDIVNPCVFSVEGYA